MPRDRGGWQRQVGLIAAIVGLGCLPGCVPASNSSESEVVVYVALDREFSAPIFESFQAKTGIRVRAKYDTEANKTVGLTHLIMNQRDRPSCDVFWNNEILNTLRLAQHDLLSAYNSPAAVEYPSQYRSPRGQWHGFAARARVLLVNTDRVAMDDRPTSILDILKPQWRRKVAIAKPLFGTTATHAACLFEAWGSSAAQDFFRAVRDSANILPGNRQVAQAVGAGQLAFGLTDTDDAWIEVARGSPVDIVYPDQHQNGIGTLFIPNTLSIIRGGPNRDAARKLVDFLLSSETEARLAKGSSAQIPLQSGLAGISPIQTPAEVKAMRVDFAAAAEHWDEAAIYLRDTFSTSK